MTILWINLALVFIFSYFARYYSTITYSPNFPILIKPNKALILGVIVCLVLVSGLRGSSIGDTGAYTHSYIINDFTWNYVTSHENIGFSLFQMILKQITNDPQILLLISALITNALIVLVFYKYSRMIEISIFVYITSGLFITSMNGLRQCLTAAIIFAATKYLFEGNWRKYFLVVLIASTIHLTALILIPSYFIVRRKAWTRVTVFLILISVLIVLGFNQFSEILFTAIEDTQYGGYREFSEGGANIIRVAVEGVPLLIAFLGREKLRKIMPHNDIIINMAMISLVFMIISTQNWIFARFAIYFTLYQMILSAWIIILFKKNYHRFIYFSMVICYVIYHYYESVIKLEIIYQSNFLDSIL